MFHKMFLHVSNMEKRDGVGRREEAVRNLARRLFVCVLISCLNRGPGSFDQGGERCSVAQIRSGLCYYHILKYFAFTKSKKRRATHISNLNPPSLVSYRKNACVAFFIYETHVF